MPEQRIGECSICGGDVVAHVGPWMATVPPPPPRCTNCGATSAAHDPIIPMRPKTVRLQDSRTFGSLYDLDWIASRKRIRR